MKKTKLNDEQLERAMKKLARRFAEYNHPHRNDTDRRSVSLSLALTVQAWKIIKAFGMKPEYEKRMQEIERKTRKP